MWSEAVVWSYLVHLQGQHRVLLTGHNHHGVGARYGGSEQRDEAEERSLVRTGHSDDSDRFVDLDDGPCQSERRLNMQCHLELRE